VNGLIPSGGGAGGALARSIRALTVGSLQSFNERQSTYQRDAIGEIDQQYVLKISGTIEEDAVWVEDVAVTFEAPFINGTEDRNVPFLYPHFTYGTVVPGKLKLVVTCNVVEWIYEYDTDADGGVGNPEYVRGCTIEVGVFRPDDQTDLANFTVELHLNFQGWGGTQPDEPNPDDDLTDDPSIGGLEGA
jgi:hypothetical protein